MLNIEVVAYIGAVQAMLVAAVLMTIVGGNVASNRLLATLLLASGLYLFFSGVAHQAELYPFRLNVTMSWINFSFGPLLWLYVCSLAEANFSMRSRQWLHFLPVLLGLLIMIGVYATTDSSNETYYALGATITLLLTVSLVTYSFMSLRVLNKHQRDIEQLLSSAEQVNLTWLKLIVGAILAYVAFGVVSAIVWEMDRLPALAGGLRIAVLSYLLCYLTVAEAVLHPEIFSNQYHELLLLKEQQYQYSENRSADDSSENKQSKYQRSGLSEEEVLHNFVAAQQYLQRSQIYLQPDLRISTLADALEISINHLSQSINVAGSESFYDLINGFRIEHAKQLLNDKSRAYKSVIDIALDSGFNSQSAFYKAFKCVEGITPAKYRKLQVACP